MIQYADTRQPKIMKDNLKPYFANETDYARYIAREHKRVVEIVEDKKPVMDEEILDLMKD